MTKAEMINKTYILNLDGIIIEDTEIENTTIHICRNGEWCEIPFDKNELEEVNNETII
tara:strand:+ start:564 stop:737 length:174 start_codon:yes stop_codon:yes gene_type:complete